MSALIMATQLLINNMNRSALTIAIGFDDHVSTYIVDRKDMMVESVGGRDLNAEQLKDIIIEVAEDVIDGDQGELFLDTTDPQGAKEFWVRYDELVD